MHSLFLHFNGCMQPATRTSEVGARREVGVRPQVGDGSPRRREEKRSKRERKSGSKGPGEEDNRTLRTDTDRNSQRVIHGALGNESSKKFVISAGFKLISFLQASWTRWVSSMPRGYRLFLVSNPDHAAPQIVWMTHRHQQNSIRFPSLEKSQGRSFKTGYVEFVSRRKHSFSIPTSLLRLEAFLDFGPLYIFFNCNLRFLLLKARKILYCRMWNL